MPENLDVQIESSPDFTDFPSVYSNVANLAITGWDFRILFGEIVPGKPQEMAAKPRASVVMSQSHFKALVYMLASSLKEYENKNGTIQWPQPPQPGE